MKKIAFILALLTGMAFGCGGSGESSEKQDSTHTESGSTASTPAASPTNPPLPIVFTASINGKEWKATPMQISVMFDENGSSLLQTKDPLMTIVFTSAHNPDNRQFLMYVKNFKGKTGKVDYKNLEILFSGSETGDPKAGNLSSNLKDQNPQPFNLEITRFEKTSETELLVSGNLSGELPGTMGSPSVKIENGVFTDLRMKYISKK